MPVIRVRVPFIPIHLAIGAFAITILACGAADTDEPDRDPGTVVEEGGGEEAAAGDPGLAPPEGAAPAAGEVGAFTARIAGSHDTLYTAEAATRVDPATNCAIDRPARFSFMVYGEGGDRDITGRFRAITGTVLGPGQTGSFRADTVAFWYPRFGLPSRTTYRGHGTLEITYHDASADSPRLVGRIVGRDMRDAKGEAVELDLAFDMGRSCGVEQ